MARTTIARIVNGQPVRAVSMDNGPRDPIKKNTPGKSKKPPLGDPPSYFDDNHKLVWNEISCDMPWLRVNHRTMFELYVRCIAKMRYEYAEFSLRDSQIMMCCADRLGGNPISDQYFQALNEPDITKDEFFD